jgi:arylsulfatase A-like enzyme
MPRQESSRPNVIYFHVDNLGYGELGCYGGGISEEPRPAGSISSQKGGSTLEFCVPTVRPHG